jgi:transcriptional regulator with XRE-family HTH domain
MDLEEVFKISNLKEIRMSKGFTQDDMAKLLGYKGKSGYCQLESGVVKMTIEKALAISNILKVDPIIFLKN